MFPKQLGCKIEENPDHMAWYGRSICFIISKYVWLKRSTHMVLRTESLLQKEYHFYNDRWTWS